MRALSSACLLSFLYASVSCGSAETAACSDNMKNYRESDIDCGGNGACGRCADGRACVAPTDCTSGVCTDGACAPAPCTDQEKNGNETDTDCGGGCRKCNDGLLCLAPIDCLSGVCTDGRCTAATCTDEVKNGTESAVDCGGSCSIRCGLGEACLSPVDCASGACDANVCVLPPVLTTVTPALGSTVGGYDIAISGANFPTQAGAVTVTIGGLPAVVKLRSPTRLTVTVPANLGRSGLVDVVLGTRNSGVLTAAGAFRYFYGAVGFGSGASMALPYPPSDVTTADLNSDQNLDLIVATGIDPGTGETRGRQTSIFLGNGDGTFQPQVDYAIGKYATDIKVADLNGDNKLDIVESNGSDSTLTLLLGNGDGTFNAGISLATYLSPYALVIVDSNGDNYQDIVVTQQDSLGILLGNGDGTFKARTDLHGFGGTLTPAGIGVGDVNRDNKPDLCVGVVGSPAGFVLLGKGDGTFRSPISLVLPSGGGACHFADFNNDKLIDVAFADNGSSVVRVFLGRGDGTFTVLPDVATGGGPRALRSPDVNGDGLPDLISANSPSFSVSTLLGRGDGTFLQATNWPTNCPVGLTYGDV